MRESCNFLRASFFFSLSVGRFGERGRSDRQIVRVYDMSEHHRVAGGWGTASPGTREDASGGTAWWSSGLNTVSAEQQQQQQQQNLHQHLMNQQQQLSQQQQQQAQQQQHHQDIVRSTAAATQQLFSYKMASSFQNPATTGTQSNPVSTSTPVGSCMRGGYDYRLGTGPGSGGGVPGTPSAPPPGVQWWYPGGVMDAGQNNLHQQLQGQQQQHLSPITTQTSTPPVMSPVCCDHDRPPFIICFFVSCSCLLF